MKKMILITLTAFTFLSCSKDDDTVILPVTPVSPTIIDDWSIEKSGTMNESNQVTDEEDWSSDCTTKKDYMLLTSPSSFTANYFSSACESTFFAQENGTYSLNATNDRLTISRGTDWDGTYQILTLTNSELVLKRVTSSEKVNRLLPQINYYKFSRRN